MISELTYRCGYCGLYVSGLIGEVLETMHLHEHDWSAVVKEVNKRRTLSENLLG